MKPTETGLGGIRAGKSGDADTIFLKKHCAVLGLSQMGEIYL